MVTLLCAAASVVLSVSARNAPTSRPRMLRMDSSEEFGRTIVHPANLEKATLLPKRRLQRCPSPFGSQRFIPRDERDLFATRAALRAGQAHLRGIASPAQEKPLGRNLNESHRYRVLADRCLCRRLRRHAFP